ncbi:MAG: hypothetical protein BGO51_19300 [Rhodospirillales bacterium 69-11]|nr:BLUF domain-containing protein [Rhodospirillales bacterium]OJW28624.1 MAG: hypothetical protein BGO51_19300 [Rhodospirillales bacterium 69-11]
MADSEDLFRLIYFSDGRLVSDPFAPLAALQALVGQAARNNSRRRITGALLYDGERFAQVLEGRREDVDAVFHEISHDPRHERVTVIQRESVRRRAFARWTALFVDPTLDRNVTLAQTEQVCSGEEDDPTALLALLSYCCSPA